MGQQSPPGKPQNPKLSVAEHPSLSFGKQIRLVSLVGSSSSHWRKTLFIFQFKHNGRRKELRKLTF